MEDIIKNLRKIDSDIQCLIYTRSLLEWDQETYMPGGAIDGRAEQIALIESLIHDKITNPKVGESFDKIGINDNCLADPKSMGTHYKSLLELEKSFLREMYREYRRNIRLPKELVYKIAKQTSLAQAKWVEARKASDFNIFAPNLKTLIQLTIQKADYLGYEKDRYEPLLDEYEPWVKPEQIDKIFSKLSVRLKPLLSKIVNSRKKIDEKIIERTFPIAKQREFGISILESMGFDFTRGRLDISAHPFTTTLGSSDIRLTTRYNENYFNSGIFGIIHECGHGLYELGFSKEIQGTLLARGTSLGIHESQSRLWENIVGRGKSFWYAYFPALKKLFADVLSDISLDTFYEAINAVKPSFIRVEADEVTYNLHIILRYNLERALISGDLSADDLPDAWREESEKLLGIIPEKDSEGVLQDIHWSMGAFGYFPTYTLGNLYSAQFYRNMQNEIPDIEDQIENKNLRPVLNWLKENIHQYGSIYPADQLCLKVTGENLKPDYFIDYLERKYKGIYEF